MRSAVSEQTQNAFMESLLAGHWQPCRSIVNQLLDQGVGVRHIYVDLLERALYRVGDLWEAGRISVALEHAATALVQRLLPLIQERIFHTPRLGKRAVVSCVVGEHHQIGAMMVADRLEMCGWDTHFLGANVPARDVVRYVEDVSPDLLCLSLSVLDNYEKLLDVVILLQDDFQDLPVAVGGQAFRHGGRDISTRFPAVRVMPSAAALERFLSGL